MPHLKIELFGPLKDRYSKELEVEIPEKGVLLDDFRKLVMKKLGISQKDIDSIAIVKNDSIVNDNVLITSSDKICLLPPVSGG